MFFEVNYASKWVKMIYDTGTYSSPQLFVLVII